MITEKFFELVHFLLNAILSLLDILPEFPATLVNSLNSFFDLLFDNLSLFGFFVRIDTVKIVIPLFIAAYNFEYIYRFIMWILRKIPALGIE